MNLDHYWQAVCERDARYDGCFVFAVGTTGIYCRPSCPARRPRRENVTFHVDAEQAEQAGFRPCKRCAPHQFSPAQQLDALVAAACRLLDEMQPTPTLAQLAARIGLSPSHLARAFKARTTMTPKAWAMARRRERLATALPQASSVLAAALDSGFSGTRALYERAQGLGPASRRHGGKGEVLHFTVARCALGHLLLASSDKGLCALLFGDSVDELQAQLRQRFANATLLMDQTALHAALQAVLRQIDEPQRAANLPLDLRGSAFQQQVWRALQAIPCGQTRAYGELAAQLGSHPRAVARACSSNPLGLLVPCHRVTAANGSLGGYRWGLARKQALLGKEAEAASANAPESR